MSTIRNDPHPFGVLPTGNLLLAPPSATLAAVAGRCGWLGSALADEGLLHVLGLLDVHSLCRCASVCRALHVFSAHDPLWRDIVLLEWVRAPLAFTFNGSWRAARRGTVWPPCELGGARIFSDALHRPWQCAHTIPEALWLQRECIERCNAAELSTAEFVRRYEERNLPVVIEGAAASWPALHRWSLRAPEDLLKRCGDATLRVGPVDMRLGDFLAYAREQHDEAPLYVFDCKFVEKVPALGDDYESPAYFVGPCRDLFALLGARRPDWRWLIIGPSLSGSKWHIDPNASSAWNVTVTGAKKWIMYPPGQVPPGVLPSSDMGSVVQPVSIIEWFMGYYDTAVHPVEFTTRPGDCVFVPRGWWHAVLNLEPTIAVTQNYAPPSSYDAVLAFLRDCPEQVSGVSGGHEARQGLHNALLEVVANDPHMHTALGAATRVPPASEAASGRWARLKERAVDTTERRGETLISGGGSDAFSFSFKFPASDNDKEG